MNLRIMRVSVAILLLASIAQAQPDSLWSRTFGGYRDDRCSSLIQTADGGFALAGITWSFGAGGMDFWLIRTDEDGDSLWSRTFGGDINEGYNSLIQTTDGGFALAGWTTSFGAGEADFWLVKTDGDGDSLWSRTLGGGFCFSLIQTAEGGFALAGIAGNDFYLVKTNEDGDSLWSRTYGGEGYEACYSLIQTADGGFALAGYTYSFGAGSNDFWLVKTDANGDSLWSRTYGGESYESCYSLIQAADGGFALGGYTESFGAGSNDFWLLKTDADGDSLWSRTFGGELSDNCYSLIQTSDSGFALAGYAESFGAGEWDFWLLKTDADGDSLWSRTFGGEDSEGCNALIQTADGGYALAGRTRSSGAGGYNFWLVKTSPDPLSAPDSDFNHHPSSFILSGVFPNPFNATTRISFGLPRPGEMRLVVLDLQGRQIAELANGNFTAGEHELLWKPVGIASGTYLIRLDAGGIQRMQKALLLK